MAPISKNILWNLFGIGAPMLAAIVVVPSLIEGMGVARFGALSLAWIIIGYFTLFDLGLSRTITHLIAQRLASGEVEEIPSLVWMAIAIMLVLGVIGATAIALLSPWLAVTQLSIPDYLKSEVLCGMLMLAGSLPFLIITTGLRGILEAYHRFDLTNTIKAITGITTYAGPLLILQYTNTVSAMVAALVGIRIASCLFYGLACLKIIPAFAASPRYNSKLLKPLVTFGGWMTLSSLIAPLLLHLGRFLLATLISTEAVAFFSTPYDILITLLAIPGAIVSVVFPILSHQIHRDPLQARSLYYGSSMQLFCAMLPLTIAIYILCEPLLSWWISEEFSRNSYRITQILIAGIFINSFGHLSQALIQAHGRPDIPAKLHVAELIAYGPYLWWLIIEFGAEGAAMGWMLRVSISTVALWVLAKGCLVTLKK